jgi:tetratricopeptide (TPR) repeat protein
MTPRLAQLLAFWEMDKTDSFTLYSIAYEYMQQYNIAEAIRFFEMLRKQKPEYTGLYYHLGKCYEQLDDPNTAMAVFEEGVKIAEQEKDFHARAELQNLIQNRLLGIEED